MVAILNTLLSFIFLHNPRQWGYSVGDTLQGVQEETLCRGFRRRHSVWGSGRDTLRRVQEETFCKRFRRRHSSVVQEKTLFRSVQKETLCNGFRRRHSAGVSGRDNLQGIP